MLRLIMPALALAAISTPALAHVGHLGDLAGHDHWVAGAAIGAAIAIGVYGALKGRRKTEKAEEPQDARPEGTEEEAGA
jgi:hydrogenase/urease accessory protein HupE